MFETHRRRRDSSAVYHTDEPMVENDGNESLHLPEEDEETDDGEIERADENGDVFSIRPKRAAKARNEPGPAVTATRGDISRFRGIPNSRPKGA